MAGLMSKRQQARNEKQLQELIKTVPGNDRCADCGTRNPGWASWSLGIFLCMSCAALHRKMGTHISKVKSLSMDSWTSDQVENMKKGGNAVSNKLYNPGNAKPDIPIDVDEAGGAMERFIRRKYELREFSGGNVTHATTNNTRNASISSAEDQPPPLPPKPGKKFSFGLRSASATFSRHRHDKFTPPMSPALSGSDGRDSPPRSNKPSRVFGSDIPNPHDEPDRAKLGSLREMGFTNAERNAMVLKEMHGSLPATVEALVRLGESNNPASRTMTPVSASSANLNGLNVDKRRPSDIGPQAPPKNDDPFAALDSEIQPQRRAATMPLPQTQQNTAYNPFYQTTAQPQASQALSDAFSSMQLFTPQQAQQYTGQPALMANSNQYNPFLTTTPQPQAQLPFQQQQQQYQYIQPLQAQHTAQPFQQTQNTNPFLRATNSQTFPQPQSNPFLQQSTPQNPWMNQAPVQSPQPQTPSHQNHAAPDFFSSQPQQQQQQQQTQYPQPQQQQQMQYPQPQQPQQPQYPPQQYQQQQYAQSSYEPAQPSYTTDNGNNPFQSQAFQHTQQQAPQQPLQQQQPQPSQSYNPYQPYQTPQQNRHDKASILSLYNYPPTTSSQPLQSLAEEPAMQSASPMDSRMRSATMPTTGSMNPFMNGSNATPQMPQMPQQPAQNVYAQTSRDSMAFVGLGGGRQSPDAFAGLSAHYGR